MAALPWQVAHGQWIGWTAAAVLTVLGALLVWALARWRARRATAKARLALASLADSPDQGPRLLRGHIEVPGGAVPAIDATDTSAACTVEASSGPLAFDAHRSGARTCLRAPLLNLKTSTGTVSIRGPVRVIAGSREWLRGRLSRMHAEDRAQLLVAPDGKLTCGTPWPKSLRLPGVIRIVRHGDEVVVRGVVRELDNPAHDGGLEVTSGPEGWIEVATASPGALSFDKPALALRAISAGLLLTLAFGLGSGAFAKRIGDTHTAALFPQHRAWAIEALRDQAIQAASGHDPLREVLAYESIRPQCKRTGAALLGAGKWEEAGDKLASCGEPDASRMAAGAYATAARFEKACEALAGATDPSGARGKAEASVFLLGACNAEASAALRRYAKWSQEHPRIDNPDAHDPKAHVRAIGCVADAIDAQAGDAQALERLSKSREEECRLGHAALVKGPARLEALSFLNDASDSEKRTVQRHAVLRDVLTATAGGELQSVVPPPIPAASALLRGAPPWSSRAHALEREVLDTLLTERAPGDQRRLLRTALSMRAAIFELMAGNPAQALRMLHLADTDVTAMHATAQGLAVDRLRLRAELTSLRVLASIVAGKPDEARSAIDAWQLEPGAFLAEVAPDGEEAAPRRLQRVRRDVVPLLMDARAIVAIAQGAKFSREADGFALATSVLLRSPSPPRLGAGVADTLRDDGTSVLDACSQPAHLMLVAARTSTDRSELRRWLQRYPGSAYPIDGDAELDPGDESLRLLFNATMLARTASALDLPEVEARNRNLATQLQSALSQHAIAVPWAAMSGL